MNFSENWHVAIDPSVYKTLVRISQKDAGRLVKALDELVRDPYAGDISKLRGHANVWRRRIGSYRIFFELSVPTKRIDVFEIERRNSKTY